MLATARALKYKSVFALPWREVARGPEAAVLVPGRSGGSWRKEVVQCVVVTRGGCVDAADGLPSDAATICS